MQDALVNALHPDKFVRASAEEYLRGLEGTSGFVWGLFEIYLKNCNENLRLVCLILARSAIARQWYVPDTANNPSPVSDSEKNQIKEFLMNKLFFNRDSNQKHLEYFILCIEAITKYSFYEQWPTLQSYLTSNLENLDEVGLKVLTTVVKTQIRRRIKYKQFKDWAQQIYPVLKRLWVHKNTLEIEKILFKCLTVLQDKEMISLLISKLKSLLACPGSEKNIKSMLKNLKLIETMTPEAFNDLDMQDYLNVNFVLITNLSPGDYNHFLLITQACNIIRELIQTNNSAMNLFGPHSLDLLKFCIGSLKIDEKWKSWLEGDYKAVLQSDTPAAHKLIISLLKVYPSLMPYVQDLLPQTSSMSFEDLHATLAVLSLLPKVFQNTPNPGISLDVILKTFQSILIEGFQKKVICRGILVLIRKWVNRTQDFRMIYEVVLVIRDLEISDLVIVYECCLVLKELFSYSVPLEMVDFIAGRFAKDFVWILNTVDIPEVVRNIKSILVTVFNRSTSQAPEISSYFQNTGLNDILECE